MVKIQMTERYSKENMRHDLEDRTYKFARRARAFLKNIEDGYQLMRASRSIGANYINANEALSKKDFLMKIKISRKEAKETNNAELENNSNIGLCGNSGLFRISNFYKGEHR